VALADDAVLLREAIAGSPRGGRGGRRDGRRGRALALVERTDPTW
jgi:hypothetical protein